MAALSPVYHLREPTSSVFTDIPRPCVQGYSDLMKSVYIQLVSFTIANPGPQDMDITDFQSYSFEFAVGASGVGIEIDDIEITQ